MLIKQLEGISFVALSFIRMQDYSVKYNDSIIFTVSFVNNGLRWLILIIANAYDSTVGNIALDEMSCLFFFLPLSFLLSLILSLQRQSCSTYPTPPL